jgi:hypothetical protein
LLVSRLTQPLALIRGLRLLAYQAFLPCLLVAVVVAEHLVNHGLVQAEH